MRRWIHVLHDHPEAPGRGTLRTGASSRAQRVLGKADEAEKPEWTRSSLAWRNALIAIDAHEAGLNYLETAAIIYGEQRATEAWQSPSRAMKDEMRRALARGRELRDGGYRDLLAAQT